MKDIDENGRDMSVMAPKKKTDLADIAKKLEDEASTSQPDDHKAAPVKKTEKAESKTEKAESKTEQVESKTEQVA
jgi:hypothetical protein